MDDDDTVIPGMYRSGALTSSLGSSGRESEYCGDQSYEWVW